MRWRQWRRAPEGLEAVRWFCLPMANDGELYRREMGYDKGKMYMEQDFSGGCTKEFSGAVGRCGGSDAKGFTNGLQKTKTGIGPWAELNRKKTGPEMVSQYTPLAFASWWPDKKATFEAKSRSNM